MEQESVAAAAAPAALAACGPNDAGTGSSGTGGPMSCIPSEMVPAGPDDAEEGDETWLLGEVKALAGRLAVGAVLRPRAAALLAEAEREADRQRPELAAAAAEANQALARIQQLRLQLLTPAIPRSASDEAHSRMEAGGGGDDLEEEDPELEALDGLLEALKARAEVQAAQARAVGEGWDMEVGERRSVVEMVERDEQQREQNVGKEEGPEAVWALLAERLKQLGVHRLAAALKESASLSRPGSSCGGSFSLPSAPASAQPTPCHSRPGSAASLVLPPAQEGNDDADKNEEEDDEDGPGESPSLLQQQQCQSQRRDRVPSLASSLGSAASWVELKENGVEALRLQVETEAARAAALRLAIAREQEAAQHTAALAQALLQQEQRRRAERQQRAQAEALSGLAGRLRRYAAARMVGLVKRAEVRAVERAWLRWRHVAIRTRLCPLAPPSLPAHVPSATMDAMEQGGVVSGIEEEDGPLAPPALPAHAPSAALVAMEEGTEVEGANTQQQGGKEEEEEERPWARLRLVTPEAAAELELVSKALEEGQRRLEALAARLAAAIATRQAALAPAATTIDEQEETTNAVVQLLPPRDPALLALLERARELAARAVEEIFRGLRLEGAEEEESVVFALDIAAIAEADDEDEEAEPAVVAPVQQPPVQQMGMGAVRAAMVEGLYEAMRERLACQAEEVAQLEALLARCQRLNREIERRTEDLRARAASDAAAAAPAAIGAIELEEEQTDEGLGPASGSGAQQLGVLRPRLKLFAARALSDAGLAVERRGLRRAWMTWRVWAWEAVEEEAGAV